MSPRTLVAQIAIALKDDTSAGAKAIAHNLKGVEKAALDLGRSGRDLPGLTGGLKSVEAAARAAAAVPKFDILAGGFGAQLDKLRLTRRELDEIRGAWAALDRQLRSGGAPKADRYLSAVNEFRTNIHRGIIEARAEAHQLAELQKSNHGLAKRAFGGAAAVVGVYGAGYTIRRGVRSTAVAGANEAREQFRQQAAGLSAGQTAQLSARSLAISRQYPSISATEVAEMGRAARNMLPSFEKALEILPDLVRARVALQSTKGTEAGEREVEDLLKSLDIGGRTENLSEIRQILDGALKATAVEGRQLPLREYLLTAKYAKSTGAALSPEFLTAIAPTFMQDVGGQRFGTQLGSMLSQLVGGRSTKESRRVRDELGLVEDTPAAKAEQKKLGIRKGKAGTVDPDLLLSNPYEWTHRYLAPALEAKGIDLSKESQVAAAMSQTFSNQMVADLFTKFITQKAQVERNKQTYGGARGLDLADDARFKDPFVAAAASMAQTANAAAALADPAMPMATTALNAYADAAGALAQRLRDDPELAKKTAETLGATGAGGLTGGVWAALSAAMGGGGWLGSIGAGIRGFLAGSLLGGGVYGSYGLSRAAAEAVKNNPEAYKPLLGNDMLGAMGGDYALGAGIIAATNGEKLGPGKAARLKDLENELRGEIWRRRANLDNFGQTSPVGAGLAAQSDAAIADLERRIREAGGTVTIAGQEVGGSLSQAIANGIAASGGLIDLQAKSIWDRIRGYFSGGIDVPVRLNPSGGVAPAGGGGSSGSPDAVPARASGGSVYPGSTYRVNEFGEEFFSPGTPGTIGKAGGGAGIGTVNISVSGAGDPNAVAERVVAVLEQQYGVAMRGSFADYGLEGA